MRNMSMEKGDTDSDSDLEESASSEFESLVNLTRSQTGMENLVLGIEGSTYDGMTLAAVLFKDKHYRHSQGTFPVLVQLIFMLGLHLVTVVCQFLLVYWTFLSGVLYDLDPYDEALKQRLVIEEHLAHDPPVSLTGNKTALNDAILKHCKADTTHGESHMVVLAIWGTRMVMELADAAWRCYGLYVLMCPQTNGKLIDWSKEHGEIKFIPRGMRIMLITVISVPQFCICIFLSWTGAKLLVLAGGMNGLVLKALTLQYIIGLDELVYNAFSSIRFKQLANSLKFSLVVPRPSRAWTMWGVNLLKLVAVVCYMAFVWHVFGNLRDLRSACKRYLDVFSEESNMHTPHWLFGDTLPSWLKDERMLM